MRIALCQMNLRVGDLEGNADRIAQWSSEAARHDVDLAVFPEQCLTGYPAEDLLLKRHFLERCEQVLGDLASRLAVPSLVGYPELADDVYNSCAVIAGGEVVGTYRKQYLPNYGVFDEQRYFRRGDSPALVRIGDVVVGLTICEDIWLATGPASHEAAAGAHVIVNLSASPWRIGRGGDRERMLSTRAADGVAAVLLCNQVCGQDELVFDGHSIAVDHEGTVIARAVQFREQMLLCDIDVEEIVSARLQDTRHRSLTSDAEAPLIATIPSRSARTHEGAGARELTESAIDVKSAGNDEPLDLHAEVYAALTLGVRDYVDKNGFRRVLLGLSGGIDSALVLAVAVDALGPDRVDAVTMPSQYSSSGTRGDAHAMARRLGIDLLELPIEPMMQAYDTSLAPVFEGREPDITEENLQARIRGNLLMALSNKFGHLVLTTGNKSEVSVGYMTLYGDMAGGFAPLKDVPKTLVYELSRWRNAQAAAAGRPEPIPVDIIERAPSAELRAGQVDQDSLPPYDVLDRILELYVEHDRSADEIVEEGFDGEVVERVITLVDRSEYKRRQAPPGIKVSSKAFGRDRRLPITNAFCG